MSENTASSKPNLLTSTAPGKLSDSEKNLVNNCCFPAEILAAEDDERLVFFLLREFFPSLASFCALSLVEAFFEQDWDRWDRGFCATNEVGALVRVVGVLTNEN